MSAPRPRLLMPSLVIATLTALAFGGAAATQSFAEAVVPEATARMGPAGIDTIAWCTKAEAAVAPARGTGLVHFGKAGPREITHEELMALAAASSAPDAPVAAAVAH